MSHIVAVSQDFGIPVAIATDADASFPNLEIYRGETYSRGGVA